MAALATLTRLSNMLLLLLLLLAPTSTAVQLTKETLTFGHSVKNGALPGLNSQNWRSTAILLTLSFHPY